MSERARRYAAEVVPSDDMDLVRAVVAQGFALLFHIRLDIAETLLNAIHHVMIDETSKLNPQDIHYIARALQSRRDPDTNLQ